MLWRLSASGQVEGRTDPGRAMYIARCAPCHGSAGKGDGPAAMALSPRPRDFTSGVYAYRSTESGSIPTDEDLLRTIREGLPGTAMPAWGKFISGDSLRAVLDYIKSLSPRFASETPQPVLVGSPVRSTTSSVKAGKAVFEKLGCAQCHGTDGAGTGAEVTDFQDAAGYPMKAANLTEPWTFRGGRTPRDIYLRFRTGLDGSPMPSYVGAASDREMWDLANYVVSLGRKPLWEMDEAQVREYYASLQERARKDPVSWGQYLVHTHGCADCHTPLNTEGGYMEEFTFAGGQATDLGAFGRVVTSNLTSDTATGLGGWSDHEIKQVLTKGIRRDDSRMLPFPMPWTAYANMTDDELNAIVAYLRTLPPIHNAIPGPEQLGFFSYLAGKFRMLILNELYQGQVYPGNAGTPMIRESSAMGQPTTAEEVNP